MTQPAIVLQTLEQFLTAKAEEHTPADNGFCVDHREYAEHLSPDALSDAWLDKGTSYIWKIGVLAQIDGNKCDHVIVHVGHERRPNQFECIGVLNYADGENDDVGRSLRRLLKAIKRLSHPVFAKH